MQSQEIQMRNLESFETDSTMTDRVEASLLPRFQNTITVGLTHKIENQYDTSVPVLLASRYENDTKAMRKLRLISLYTVCQRPLTCLHQQFNTVPP